MKSRFSESLDAALETLTGLRALEPKVEEAAALVLACLKSGGKLLLCGNGGSAADSSHMATEFTCRFQDDRRPYPAISLTADGGLLTAIGNDYTFQDFFGRQVRAYGKAGDVLIALTTSGKSRNVLTAIEEAKRAGYRGSDQAWISHVLGPGLPVLEGVHSWKRDLRRGLPRADTRVVMFHGRDKPWHGTVPTVYR
jgi:D-sedoheptulose 7-phosphate isomerase